MSPAASQHLPRLRFSAALYLLLLSAPQCLRALDTNPRRYALDRDAALLAEEFRHSFDAALASMGREPSSGGRTTSLGSGLMRRVASSTAVVDQAASFVELGEDGPRHVIHRAANGAPPKKPSTTAPPKSRARSQAAAKLFVKSSSVNSSRKHAAPPRRSPGRNTSKMKKKKREEAVRRNTSKHHPETKANHTDFRPAADDDHSSDVYYENASSGMKMVLDCKNCGECAWGGAVKTGNATLGGAGHSPKNCQLACLASATCKAAALSHSGICHMFEVCTDPTPEGDKTRWLKVPKPLEETRQVPAMTLDCENCGECAWSGADHTAQASLGSNGHSSEECKAACLESLTCQVAARSPSGYCHLFTHCSQASPDGDKIRWKKSLETVPGQSSYAPKRQPDSSYVNGATPTEVGNTTTDHHGVELMLDERQRAKFQVQELKKIEVEAGLPVTGSSSDVASEESPAGPDAETQEENLVIYGIAAFVVMLCLIGMIRHVEGLRRHDFASPKDEAVWGTQSVAEKVHMVPQQHPPSSASVPAADYTNQPGEGR